MERSDALPLRRTTLDQREGAQAGALRAHRATDPGRRRDLQTPVARRETPRELPRDGARDGARAVRYPAVPGMTRRAARFGRVHGRGFPTRKEPS
ncbi:hypothetical protein F01_530173 [Burkholderia cenocepacia]|nr:hypothetical protein F01_530173 [Burkholderia cenocepacia]